MELLPLRRDLTYGPVNSRRLGRSLGVNLFPAARKVCSFDCIYCQYGRTRERTLCAAPDDVAPAADVLEAVQLALRADPTIEYVTFSGVGEPTLHPAFPWLVDGIRRLREEMGHRARLAVLSNSSTLGRPEVFAALFRVDAPIMKLDAGDADTLNAVNAPVAGVRMETIIEALAELGGPILQALFVDGPVSNARGAALQAWLGAVRRIRPRSVQVYSTDRAVPETSVRPVAPQTLQRIAAEVRTAGAEATAYWR
jgi:wyosine [tRNA(Phe)-imidazoG37] synthetase (radical SAM superfamily)